MTDRRKTRYVTEGDYFAVVDIVEIQSSREIAPHSHLQILSPEDAEKIDAVRIALRNCDIGAAAKLAKVYELKPIAAE